MSFRRSANVAQLAEGIRFRNCIAGMETNNINSIDSEERLPENVYDSIIAYLPIRDAVRTSFVSRAWRYRWRSIPHLVFDQASFPKIDREKLYFESRRVSSANRGLEDHWNDRFVDQVLQLHDRQCICSIEITAQLFTYSAMNKWIPQLLTCSSLERFILVVEDPNQGSSTREDFRVLTIMNRYFLPEEFFSFQHLTNLELRGCRMRVPADFSGFPCLTSLVMNDIYYVDVLEAGGMPLGNFISSIKKLRRLQASVGCIGHLLEVSLPDLQTLDLSLEYCFDCLRLNTPKVTSVRITLAFCEDDYYGTVEGLKDYNLANLLANCPLMEELVINDRSTIIPIGYHKSVPRRLPNTFDHLKYLDLSLTFYFFCEVTMLSLCLLRSSPALKHLRLCVNSCRDDPFLPCSDLFWEPPEYPWHYPDVSFWEAQEATDCRFNSLEKLEFDRVEGGEEEMALIRFLIENTPFLLNIGITVRPKRCSEVKLRDSQLHGIVQELLKVKKNATQGILRHQGGSIIF